MKLNKEQKWGLKFINEKLRAVQDGKMKLVSISVENDVEEICNDGFSLSHKYTGYMTIKFAIRPTGVKK